MIAHALSLSLVQDTVNIASRMMTSSRHNHVQITPATAARLRQKFKLRHKHSKVVVRGTHAPPSVCSSRGC
jgi:class 3 adenylate cyclase